MKDAAMKYNQKPARQPVQLYGCAQAGANTSDMNTRIKAFTLIELLIAVVIGSILIYMALSIYLTLNRTFEKARHDINKQMDMESALYILSKDIQASAYWTGRHDLFAGKVQERPLIWEQTDSVWVRRFGTQTDTIHTKFEVVDVDYVAIGSGSLIQSIIVHVPTNHSVQLKKNYSSQQILHYAH